VKATCQEPKIYGDGGATSSAYRKFSGARSWNPSLLKKNRNLETNSFVLKDAEGQPIRLEGPHIAVEDLVPLIPPTAYRAVTVGDNTYWTFTLAVRLPGLGKVRLVVSFKNAELTGTYAVLVSNRVDWNAHRILTLYLQRWPIETFYQDGKGHLGQPFQGIGRIRFSWPGFSQWRRGHRFCMPFVALVSSWDRADVSDNVAG
jgi:hypothetical protein